jgi:hypothetical protein
VVLLSVQGGGPASPQRGSLTRAVRPGGTLSEDEPIIIGPPVYVFKSGEGGHYGLSLFRDGSNLPASVDGLRRWTFLQQVTMEDSDLLPYVEDTAIARSHLTICGSYRTRPATVLGFPTAQPSWA